MEPLIEMLEREKESWCKMASIAALIRIGDFRALPVLDKLAKKDKSKTIRHLAEAASRQIEKENPLAGENK